MSCFSLWYRKLSSTQKQSNKVHNTCLEICTLTFYFVNVSKVNLRNADLCLHLKLAVSLAGQLLWKSKTAHLKKKTTKAHSLLLLNIFLQNMHRITSLKELNCRMTFSCCFFINYADLMIFLDSTFTYFLLRHWRKEGENDLLARLMQCTQNPES